MRKRMMPADLPFVGKATATKPASFWNVPATGDYADGTRIGIKMASAYAIYLKSSVGMPPILPQIVLDMMSQGANTDALHGQIVGFFSSLEEIATLRRFPDG